MKYEDLPKEGRQFVDEVIEEIAGDAAFTGPIEERRTVCMRMLERFYEREELFRQCIDTLMDEVNSRTKTMMQVAGIILKLKEDQDKFINAMGRFGDIFSVTKVEAEVARADSPNITMKTGKDIN